LTGKRKTKAPSAPRYELRLLVSGSSPRSLSAIERITKICEEHLQGDYSLEVIDLYTHPTAAAENDVIAAPTLVRRSPLPIRRFVGDLRDATRLLSALRSRPAT
jgi:circadian clock protein KaiB